MNLLKRVLLENALNKKPAEAGLILQKAVQRLG
jgi:hypothetical protein